MVRRILTFSAAFFAGVATWLAFSVLKASNPFLPWEYPLLRFFIGMTFPGGATPTLYYLSHVAQTWFPFLVAFFVSFVLTNRKARITGGIAIYVAFLIWSWAMLILDALGVDRQAIFYIGLGGTFLGGLCLYLWLVAPRLSE